MAPVTFEIPPQPAKTFSVSRNERGDIELVLLDPIRTRGGTTIHAFCLPEKEAAELGRELVDAALGEKP